MKLDKKKWIQEVHRVETEIKLLKKKMHESYYESTFPFNDLFKLKAEATRLYTLRRVIKQKDIDLKSFWYLVRSNNGKYVFTYHKNVENLTFGDVISLILDGVPDWKESFLIQDV